MNKHRTLLVGTAVAMALTATAFATDAVGISNVEYHTTDEILTLYHLLNLDESVSLSYDVQPDLTSLSTSGTLSTDVVQNALDTLNFARYIAGLNYDVTISNEYALNAQNGALALAALGGGADHYISQPSGMSDDMFASAYIGTTNGNLSAGIGNLATNVIHGWLSDEGDNNAYTLGHRRYALASSLTETGFGLVIPKSSAKYDAYSVMNVQGATAGNATGVVWPAQNMPVEYFGDNYPWSFTWGSPISGDIAITITRENDGKTWEIVDEFIDGPSGDGFISINNDYYVQPGCIIFEPDNIHYSAGDVYHVEIVNNTVNASYTVNFFSLSDSYTVQSHVTAPDTTVEVVPETPEVPEETAPTGDISGASSWAQAELSEALEAGFPVALYDDKFTRTMTRGEFAHMLGLFCNMKWSMSDDYFTPVFTDLGDDPDDAERNMYINILNNWGIIDGTSATTFEPDATITREAIAKLLLGVQNLYLNVSVTQDISSFADASSVSSWALEGVRYMNQLGVLNGTSDNRINPQGNITVEEAALMCYRLFG